MPVHRHNIIITIYFLLPISYYLLPTTCFLLYTYSMSDTIIKVENLSKQYQLGQVGTGTLTRDLQRWYCRITGKEDPTLKIGQENILSAHRSPLT